MEYKQAIVFRADLQMSPGKACAQAAHASLESYKKAARAAAKGWESEGCRKIVLQVPSLDDLLSLKKKASGLKLPNALITDAGLTEFDGPTTTCLGIGPAPSPSIDKVTGSLRLLG